MDSSDLWSHLQHGLGATYTITRELGGGGMARVFLADDTSLGRRVVVKVLSPELAEALSVERFGREVRLAAGLQHPNILPVFTAGAVGGAPYYTMPYVEGESLRARLDRGGAMSTVEAVGILRDVARALAHAHENGVVHRDVKPENVLLSRDAAVVADFGIAKAVDAARTAPQATALTQLGTAIGTPAYMAPEQASGEPEVDQRADLYAWGVVAHELLAGRHPFADKRGAQALFVAHLIERPPSLDTIRSDLPAALVALVTRCLAKAPDERPASARELVDVLSDLASSVNTLAGPFRSSLPSIAVLPFINLSADPENEYFSEGMSEEVLNVLAQEASLRVAARSSSFAFKGTHVELRTIAQQLHVTTLLEGSVRRAGSRVRITAQLVNAADGYQLWSDRYDRELHDIFAVQDEIANAIAATLVQRLRETAGTPAPTPRAGPPPARRTRRRVSVEAYDEYLKGRHANRDMRGVGHEPGPVHFRRALALEPGYAAAHAGLAESHLWLTFSGLMPPTESFAVVRRHARRALAIDPELADAHWLLGEVALWHDWDVDAAEQHSRDALALEEHHAEAIMTRAICHCVRGRKAETLADAATAVHIDPLGVGTRIWFVAQAFNVGEIELTRVEASRLIDEKPMYSEAFRWRAMAHLLSGDLIGARRDLGAAAALDPGNAWGARSTAMVASQEGNVDETRRIRDELVRRSAEKWESPLMIGQVEQALGNFDAAFEWYERAFRTRDHLLTVLHTDPSFRMTPPNAPAPIEADPRWAALIQRIGLAPG